MRGKRFEKAKRISAKVFRNYHHFHPRNKRLTNFPDKLIQRLLGIYRKTKVPCSCYMCGNPRKLGKLTRKEIIQRMDTGE